MPRTTNSAGGRFVLVDQRDKPQTADEMCRLCADIESLPSAAALREAAHAAWPAGAPVVVVANHLCGSALDHSIELFRDEAVVAGFCAATCCHDRCAWTSYCNRRYFASLRFGEAEFTQLCAWSVLAPRRNKPPGERSRVRAAASELGLGLSQCETLGAASRLLIDTGRRLRLEALGLHSQLRYHVPFELTADNVLIVAHRPPPRL
ncbi:methyltransferase TRM13 [Pavlovales sp. CCMP2436]|nr:methyltransferase TRM13 [Pavlovales sp. CCMP2436]